MGFCGPPIGMTGPQSDAWRVFPGWRAAHNALNDGASSCRGTAPAKSHSNGGRHGCGLPGAWSTPAGHSSTGARSPTSEGALSAVRTSSCGGMRALWSGLSGAAAGRVCRCDSRVGLLGALRPENLLNVCGVEVSAGAHEPCTMTPPMVLIGDINFELHH